MQRRVVITGMGVISPIGLTLNDSFASLLEGRHGIRYMPEWDFFQDIQCRVGATVQGIDLAQKYDRKTRRTMGRVSLLALASTEEALAQAGLTGNAALLESGRCGISYGSTSGSSSEVEKFSRTMLETNSMRGLEPNAYLRMMAHTCAANLASHLHVRGRVQPTASACTSGSQAVGEGFEAIRAGIADVMVCGGAEEMHYTTAVTFDLLMATSTKHNGSPGDTPRPFDRDRDGLVVGEGAGTLILEEYEHARARGAQVLGEMVGYASNCDGAHLTQPSSDGMRRVIEESLACARVHPRDVGYVNAHATGTPVGDVAESRATWDVFKRAIPISTQKGFVGHTLGACGAIEAAWTLKMMATSTLVPNRNLVNLDPECPSLGYVREPTRSDLRIAVSNNFAFGGVNTSIVLQHAAD